MQKPGLRLQLLILIGGLLVVTFLPLQLALATYTRVTLRRLDDRQARDRAEALSAYVELAQASLAPEDLARALGERFGPGGLLAARVTSESGETLARVGSPEVLADLKAREAPEPAEPRVLERSGRRVLSRHVGSSGRVVALAIDAEQASSRGAPLIGMFGLYAFLIACSLLLLAYFALTRLIVRPLDQLSQAAQSVTLGSRQLAVPHSSVRELGELGVSLKRMTDRLLSDEESLRKKITEVQRATAELRQAQDHLVRSERMASVGRLAAGIAHEIGNPIAALIGLQDLLLEGELEERERRDFIERMRQETERINRTLRDLLDFARAPEKEPSLDEPGDVRAAAVDTTNLVAHQSSLKEIELTLDLEPGLPAVAMSTERLMQVLLNLVLNAADALEDAAGGAVCVSAREHAGGVQIDVVDNGPGVPAELADRIFEPFFTTKEVGKGTGLGLSVCQGLVERVQGRIELLEAERGGAHFTIWLPRAPS